MRLTFVYLPLAARELSDNEWQVVERLLLENPNAGVVVPGTGGVRKLRVAFEHRGKRGSARTLYLHIEAKSKVYFLLAYAKNVKETVSESEKQAIRALVARLKQEGGT